MRVKSLKEAQRLLQDTIDLLNDEGFYVARVVQDRAHVVKQTNNRMLLGVYKESFSRPALTVVSDDEVH